MTMRLMHNNQLETLYLWHGVKGQSQVSKGQRSNANGYVPVVRGPQSSSLHISLLIHLLRAFCELITNLMRLLSVLCF